LVEEQNQLDTVIAEIIFLRNEFKIVAGLHDVPEWR
jgi:hypothetical protein